MTEREDIIETLATHRGFLRHTVEGLTDEQATQRTTVSELCLAGVIKHVAQVEERWVDFIQRGPEVMAFSEANMQKRAQGFQMLPGETLAGLLDSYDEVAARTEALVMELPSLDIDQPLPDAPWFEPGARWSARRTLVHILAETAQHAGHADIIRESLDGAKTMG
ncbi:MAG: DinB family protein [Acidimicrobiaceae bacterium]|nr:DinB family protein [Acidimicrobiaceae bacterium]